MREADQITGAVAYHGEGAVWAKGRLHWLDMLAGDVLTLAPKAVRRFHVGETVACVRPTTAGGFVYALDRQIAISPPGAGHRGLERGRLVFDDPELRFNEGGCSPQGDFYVGTTHNLEMPERGTLWRISPDLQATRELVDVSESNGIDWSPSGEVTYYVDSPTGRIDRLTAHETGHLSDRVPFVVIDDGVPDGLTVDSAGGIWVAIWGAGQVRRYDAHGELTDVVTVRASQPTSCALGGKNLQTLFISTSRQGLSRRAEPSAGAIFAIKVHHSGSPVRPFRAAR
ncbi:SMP-30/gluconolactonase/LRE family protein [Herbiconiux sp. KACC 21604]|uniref:SMP-30/gluconolactonase/LRE family protein n=1 Tax=unclassified Herbiconiux TaxID=2618217 RepID=UPI001491922F|nr:SMP-30/gluconolactonase/LRE family protein [Herbiconiux sp. SALV-R1]QJU55278.1 SMP-30/gluconolactonase/LRE family protein [Herbiconiux sp. SALV-R1]WPO86445.1 SMP-30/gluconolactonase/LRE family protein [Herbiconiux sp. KACC 21604]